MMGRCPRCGSVTACPRCNGKGLVRIATPATAVWASCGECWGTGVEHDPEQHPDPDEPRSSGWAGADR